ncbi:MAG: hypothetical protein PHO00_02375 [bacterium]|nr:hypothetical protein [bacterium]
MKKTRDILAAELSELLKTRKELSDTIDSFPAGTMVRKTIKGKPYYYLAKRDGKRVRFSYMGKMSDEDLKTMKNLFALRKKYLLLAKSLKRQAASLKRLLSMLEKT